MRLGFVLALAILPSVCVAAHADTISTFNFSGTPVVSNGDPNTLNGSLTIDTTTGIVQAASLTSGTISLSGVVSQSAPVIFIGTAMFDAKFSGDAGSFINYMGGAFDLSGLRPTTLPNEDFVGHVTFGSSATTVVTPEPSSILLFGTGVAGIACLMMRRRLPVPAPMSAV